MASNPTTPLSARKQFLSTITASNDGDSDPTDDGNAGGGGGSTRIPIARNGSIRRMRNSKSFSNDHQLSKSLTQSDHYYVSQLNKKDFLTLDKFGSAGSMHKAHMASGGAAGSASGSRPLPNGDVTDSTVIVRQQHHHHHHNHHNKLSLQTTVATVVAATNSKHCNGGERSLVSANHLASNSLV